MSGRNDNIQASFWVILWMTGHGNVFFCLYNRFYRHLSRLRLETRLLLILLYLPCTPTTLEILNNRLISRKQMSYRVVFGRNDYKRALFWVISGRNDQEWSRFFVGYPRIENPPKSYSLSLARGDYVSITKAWWHICMPSASYWHPWWVPGSNIGKWEYLYTNLKRINLALWYMSPVS